MLLARIVVCSLAVATIGCSSASPEADTPTGSSTTSGPAIDTDDALDRATLPNPEGELPDDATPVTIVHITDGDSLDIELDGVSETIRLVGMNANEGSECFGPEAREALIALFAKGQPGIEVIDGRDDFGRLLVYAWAGDTLVNLAMVENGYAVARAISRHPFEVEFQAAEVRAHDSNRGLWAPDACGPTTGAAIEIVDLFYNAPGADDENPNGEWILIENTGDTAVELTGWAIKDESTRHRFEFPQGEVLQAGASAIVYSGCGSDGDATYYWCSGGGGVWSNSGDTGFLMDPSGNIVDSWSYTG